MKKILIASLVGGIILFVWHSVSWMLMPTHLDSFQYSPAQDSILNTLKNSGIKTGAYFMPSIDHSNVKAFDSEYQKKCAELMKTSVGKPAASIFYVDAMPDMSAAAVLYGFLYDFIAVLCACLLLSLAFQSDASFLMRWWMVMLFAVFYIMEAPMSGHNWLMEPWHYTKGFIYDAFIGWGLTGLWIASYLKRK